MNYTAGSLFTGGVAGIDVAFEAVGINPVWQIENDPFSINLLEKRYPEVKRFQDIREVKSECLQPVDVMFGGFPCVDISGAGKGEGIKYGNRSGLWYEFARIISDLRPRYVLLENVGRIISKGRGWEEVFGTLREIGYDAAWRDVWASDVGSPQKRERWICLAYPTSKRLERSKWSELQEVGNRSSFSSEKLAYSDSTGLERRGECRECSSEQSSRSCSWSNERDRIIESELGRMFDGSSSWVDRSRWPAGRNEAQHDWEPPRVAKGVLYRKDRVRVIGNAVVPQIILPFAYLIKTLLEREDEQRLWSINSTER